MDSPNLTKRRYQAAAVQLCSTADKSANLRVTEDAIRTAANEGAELIVLPELFNCLGAFPEIIEAAEPIPGPTSDRMSRLAAELRVHLCAGSICEASSQHGRGYNTALLFDDTGELILQYRKIHLFQIRHAGQPKLSEPDFMLPGARVACAQTKLGNLGLATCYDLRFPELFRELADAEVDIVLFPSAFTHFTGAAHWHTLVRARAIENQCFVVASNQTGNHNDALRSYGHSTIVDAWGNELAAANEDAPVTIHAQLDLDKMQSVREQLPALSNRSLQQLRSRGE